MAGANIDRYRTQRNLHITRVGINTLSYNIYTENLLIIYRCISLHITPFIMPVYYVV